MTIIRILTALLSAALLMLCVQGASPAQDEIYPRNDAERRAFESFQRSIDRGDEDRAIRNGTRACERGNTHTCAVVAIQLLQDGYGEDELRAAAALYTRACEAETSVLAANSCNQATRIYAGADSGPLTDFPRALALAERGCAMNAGVASGEVCWLLGELLTEEATGLGIDVPRSLDRMMQGCELGEGNACVGAFNRAYFLATQASTEEEEATLAQLAATGPRLFTTCEVIQLGCGLASEGLRVGLFGPSDRSRAEELGRIGCEAGNPFACEQLGAALRDRNEADTALNRACDSEIAAACVRLLYRYITYNDTGAYDALLSPRRDGSLTAEQIRARAASAAMRACELGQGEGCYWAWLTNPDADDALARLEAGCEARAYTACYALESVRIAQAQSVEDLVERRSNLSDLCPTALLDEGYCEFSHWGFPLALEGQNRPSAPFELVLALAAEDPVYASVLVDPQTRETSDPDFDQLTAQMRAAFLPACRDYRAVTFICALNSIPSGDDRSEALENYLDGAIAHCAGRSLDNGCGFAAQLAALDLNQATPQAADFVATHFNQNRDACAQGDGTACERLLQIPGGWAPLTPDESGKILQSACNNGSPIGCRALLDFYRTPFEAAPENRGRPNPAKAHRQALNNCRFGMGGCDF